jgi:hypothetical protein
MVTPVINIHDQATLKHPPLSLSYLFPLAARRAQLSQIPELQQSDRLVLLLGSTFLEITAG